MLGRNRSEPALFQYVNVEELVPKNHFLRKVDAVLDLSFVRETVAECYSASRGRPSIDPELALSNCVVQVLCTAVLGHHGWLVRTIALRTIRSFRMHATIATFDCFPRPFSCS